jgi:hypothetical protein
MNRCLIARTIVLCRALLIIVIAHSLIGVTADAADDASTTSKSQARPSVKAAREQALLMHCIYAATLDAMHHHYFHSNKAVLPARAMEDVFAAVARDTQATARWISVNTKAMSIEHEPKSEFEKKAAAELATGKTEFELVEKGNYRRAGAIPLTDGCISCHTGDFTTSAKLRRVAGLVISIPVSAD